MWSGGEAEIGCAARLLKSSGKVQNIKGNALVPDFVHFLSFAAYLLAPGLLRYLSLEFRIKQV